MRFAAGAKASVAAIVALVGLMSNSASAAVVDAPPAPKAPTAASADPDKLLIDAAQLSYDKDHNTITASGEVQLYYKHRVLQADKVIYYRADRRVFAQGHVKLTDEKGDQIYATRLELTDDFKDGFIDRAQVLASDRSRLSAGRVERSG